jgi:hypothetical protein
MWRRCDIGLSARASHNSLLENKPSPATSNTPPQSLGLEETAD